MADAKQSVAFRVDDRLVDAWGDEVEEDSTPATDAPYTEWTGKQLAAEINSRNEDRADEDKIILEDKKKATAIGALEADDAASEDNDSEE